MDGQIVLYPWCRRFYDSKGGRVGGVGVVLNSLFLQLCVCGVCVQTPRTSWDTPTQWDHPHPLFLYIYIY